MMIVGITAAPWALRAMSTPEDILGPSTTYIRIYFLGVIGNLIYNMAQVSCGLWGIPRDRYIS